MHRLARKIEHDLNAKLAQKNNQHAEIASLLTECALRTIHHQPLLIHG